MEQEKSQFSGRQEAVVALLYYSENAFSAVEKNKKWKTPICGCLDIQAKQNL